MRHETFPRAKGEDGAHPNVLEIGRLDSDASAFWQRRMHAGTPHFRFEAARMSAQKRERGLRSFGLAFSMGRRGDAPHHRRSSVVATLGDAAAGPGPGSAVGGAPMLRRQRHMRTNGISN